MTDRAHDITFARPGGEID